MHHSSEYICKEDIYTLSASTVKAVYKLNCRLAWFYAHWTGCFFLWGNNRENLTRRREGAVVVVVVVVVEVAVAGSMGDALRLKPCCACTSC